LSSTLLPVFVASLSKHSTCSFT